MTQKQRSTAPLSVQRAFVVQFREDIVVQAGGLAGSVAGRVEHVQSGRAKHFYSLDELWSFIVQMLLVVHSASQEEQA